MINLLEKEKDNDINRVAFFANYRKIFENRLTQGQVNGYEAIFDAFDTWEDYCLKDPAPFNRKDVLDRQLAYILATAYGEVGKKMEPVREGFKKNDADARKHVAWLLRKGYISWNYALPSAATGQSYYGRGFVQLTHEDNYIRADQLCGTGNLFHNTPSMVMKQKHAAKKLVVGMANGMFTGKGLFRYINSQETDYFHARRIINGMDRARKFEGLAIRIEKCIELEGH